VATVVWIQAKYYGWRYAFYLSGLLYICVLVAGITAHYLFAAFGILPTPRPSLQDMVGFQIDYTFRLNIAFVLIAGVPLLLRRASDPCARKCSLLALLEREEGVERAQVVAAQTAGLELHRENPPVGVDRRHGSGHGARAQDRVQ
jgi:hypothetical protein